MRNQTSKSRGAELWDQVLRLIELNLQIRPVCSFGDPGLCWFGGLSSLINTGRTHKAETISSHLQGPRSAYRQERDNHHSDVRADEGCHPEGASPLRETMY